MPESGANAFYAHLAEQLNPYGLAYLHIVETYVLFS